MHHKEIYSARMVSLDVTAINQVWCGNATYIKVGKRWMYCAEVLDLVARRIVGWSFLTISDATLTCEAMRMVDQLQVVQ